MGRRSDGDVWAWGGGVVMLGHGEEESGDVRAWGGGGW